MKKLVSYFAVFVIVLLVFVAGSIDAQERSLIDGFSALVDDTVSAVESLVRSDRYFPDVLMIGSVTGNGRELPVSETYTALLSTRLARRFSTEDILIIPVRTTDAGTGLILSTSALVTADEVLMVTLIQRNEDHSVLSGAEMRFAVSAADRALFGVGGSGGVGQASSGQSGEPDNSPDQATRISAPGTVSNRQIETPGDRDWYILTIDSVPAADEGVTVLRVETTGSTDTYLELYGPNDPTLLLAENDDFDSSNARVSVPVSTGATYYVMVRGFGDSSTGSYSLVTGYQNVVLDSFEVDDSMELATDVRIGTEATGHTLVPGGDQDWFHITGDLNSGSGGESVILSVQTISDMDTVIELYDSYGVMLTSDDDSGIDGNANIMYLYNGEEDLFLMVRGFGDSDEGPYTLAVATDTAAPDEFEPDGSPDLASEIPVNGEMQHRTFLNGEDADWLFFELTDSASVVIETYGESDTYLRLHGERLSLITEDDDSGNGYNAQIRRRLDAGTYFVEATPLWGGANTPYDIVVRTE